VVVYAQRPPADSTLDRAGTVVEARHHDVTVDVDPAHKRPSMTAREVDGARIGKPLTNHPPQPQGHLIRTLSERPIKGKTERRARVSKTRATAGACT
jgi:hypothetical protein